MNWYPPGDGTSTGVEGMFCAFDDEVSSFRFAEMRARSDTDCSLGSLLVLKERARVSGIWGGGAPSAPGGAPDAGSSVWMKQHLLP